MIKFLTLLLFCLPTIALSQNGGACIYILPGSSEVVCNVYGNAGVPSESDCHSTATALGALPLNCLDYLTGCSAVYSTTGTSCFYIGSGSCNANTICNNISLPVELIGFEAEKEGESNIITWTTASEHNSDYYTLKVYSGNMDVYDSYTLSAMGVTNDITNYRFIHHNPNNSVNYYELIQYDIDGEFTNYGYISVNNTKGVYLVKVINLMGQEVDTDYNGIVIQQYSDGSTLKSFY
jgi:hypothetical protein